MIYLKDNNSKNRIIRNRKFTNNPKKMRISTTNNRKTKKIITKMTPTAKISLLTRSKTTKIGILRMKKQIMSMKIRIWRPQRNQGETTKKCHLITTRFCN